MTRQNIARLTAADNRVRPAHPAESITFDHGRLARVCDEHGEGAEAYIAFVLTEVETLLRTAPHQGADVSALSQTCRDLVRLAGTIGMITVERVAGAVLDCADRRDGAALAACHQRLARLCEPDATKDWTMDDAARPDGAA